MDRGASPATADDVQVYTSTFLFNAFVFAQIFNEFNARSLGDDPRKAFKGILQSRIFLAVIGMSILVQALIVEFGGKYTKCSGLSGNHWMITVLLGAISLPLGVLMRWIPVKDRKEDYAEFYRDGEEMYTCVFHRYMII